LIILPAGTAINSFSSVKDFSIKAQIIRQISGIISGSIRLLLILPIQKMRHWNTSQRIEWETNQSFLIFMDEFWRLIKSVSCPFLFPGFLFSMNFKNSVLQNSLPNKKKLLILSNNLTAMRNYPGFESYYQIFKSNGALQRFYYTNL